MIFFSEDEKAREFRYVKRYSGEVEIPYDLLQKRFGFASFRGEQEGVIQRTLNGGHSLVLMPTGMGKSLCFQFPAVVFEGLTLVISPLIALMKDQVQAARKKGIRCAFINSSLSRSEREDHYRRLANKEFELLYVTPERFRKSEFMQALKQNQVSLLAIDEAHCISQWGHDFRPDYTRIEEFRHAIGDPATLALTATATPEVQFDIIRQCGLQPEEVKIFHGGLERPNLFIEMTEVVGLDDKVRHTVMNLARYPGSAVIYFSLVETLERFSHEIRRLGFSPHTYHGRMDNQRRKKAQEVFMRSENVLMLATPAFGLGVDKEDIRLVMHAEVPGSIEAYYQEIGRAGRDGKPANCVLLYDGDDISIQMDFIKWSKPEPGFIHALFRLLVERKDEVRANGLDYLRTQLNFYNRRDFRVETTINLLQRWDCVEGDVARGNYQILQEPPEEYLDQDVFAQNLKKQQEKLMDMVQLAKQGQCRKQVIYSYFGLSEQEPCGQCDMCLADIPNQ